MQGFVVAGALEIHPGLEATALEQRLGDLRADVPDGGLRADELLDLLRGASGLPGEAEAGQQGFFCGAFSGDRRKETALGGAEVRAAQEHFRGETGGNGAPQRGQGAKAVLGSGGVGPEQGFERAAGLIRRGPALLDGGLGAGQVGAAECDVERCTVGFDAAVKLAFEDAELGGADADVVLREGEEVFGFGQGDGSLDGVCSEGEACGVPVLFGGLGACLGGTAFVGDAAPEVDLPGHVERGGEAVGDLIDAGEALIPGTLGAAAGAIRGQGGEEARSCLHKLRLRLIDARTRRFEVGIGGDGLGDERFETRAAKLIQPACGGAPGNGGKRGPL